MSRTRLPIRVFMLGWEFPPFISGGLGTACYGLTRALSATGTRITFVLPRPASATPPPAAPAASDPPPADPDDWRSPTTDPPSPTSPSTQASTVVDGLSIQPLSTHSPLHRVGFDTVDFRTVAALSTNPYDRPGDLAPWADWTSNPPVRPTASGAADATSAPAFSASSIVSPADQPVRSFIESSGAGHYAGDLFTEVHRFADLAVELAKRERFDIVHAHDWMTFPAGLAVAAATGKPLVVHVHSTEYDRAGNGVDARIYDIERRGMNAALRVIAVSHLTKDLCVQRYGIAPQRIDVVYNAIDAPTTESVPAFDPAAAAIKKHEKIVLFLGRVTMQKGPEYFVAAARRVLSVMDDVKFLMAGTGDQIRRTIELAAQMGIGHKVLFTGFLRGPDVEAIFRRADLYVMPSVSEPFGIAPLEAISHGVPVLISKQSGVSEVLRNVLKVDFWDVEDMANKIVGVLRHPALHQTLRERGQIEVRKLQWADSAADCVEVYNHVLTDVAETL